MTLTSLLMVGCLMLTTAGAADAPSQAAHAAATSAQPTTARPATVAADPISGLWLDPGGSGAGLNLRYDGKSAVTGTLIMAGRKPELNPAIKVGTFNKQTGTLKLTGTDTQGDGSATFVVQGTLKRNSLTGTFVIGSAKGNFTFNRKT